MVALWVFIFVVALLILKVGLDIKEKFVPEYLHHKSSCFSCEKQMINMYGEDAAWMANPAKTFSAEKDGVLQAGGDISGGFIAKTIKYY